MQRKSLSEILRGNDRDALSKAWHDTEAAGEMGPLPAGEYVARIMAGELMTSRTNSTPGYRLTFRVCEGDYIGRRFWSEIWLTPAALPMAKRDLAKLGISSLDQLEKPIPQGIRCRVKLALRRDDNGNEHNRVAFFAVIGIDAPEVDPFVPSSNGNGKPKHEGGPQE